MHPIRGTAQVRDNSFIKHHAENKRTFPGFRITYIMKRYPQSPSIAFIVPGNGRFEEAAKLLVTSLGLPQLQVFIEGAILPSSVHSIIALGPPNWKPASYNLPLWTLDSPGKRIEDPIKINMPGDNGCNVEFQLLSGRSHVLAPSPDPRKSVIENSTTQAFYYCIKRVRKQSKPMDAKESIEWYVLLLILEHLNISESKNLVGELKNLLKLNIRQSSPYDLKRKFVEMTIEVYEKSFQCFQTISPKKKIQFDNKSFMRNPEIVVALALQDEKNNLLHTDVLDSLLQPCLNATQFAYIGLAAYMLGYDDLAAKVNSRIHSDDIFDTMSMCVHNAANLKSYCYSPVLAAFLLAACRKEHPDFFPQFLHERKDSFYWHVFDADDSRWLTASGGDKGALISEKEMKISSSLLENWLTCLSVPSLDGMQYELLEHNYYLQLFAFEACWLSFFRYLQNSTGKSLIRIKPWPFDYKAAFSLRYDVDRNTSIEQVLQIIDIQRGYLSSCCGSWFLIPGTEYISGKNDLLMTHLQEIGIHAVNKEGYLRGKGVTFHSAPGSEYWRGEDTVFRLEDAGAAYGEMLASQIIVPKPAWLEGDTGGRRTRLWLLPVHYPLEGTTQDKTLEYFDRFKDYFRRMREIGGHLIIGSHPDLNQKILIELLERENLQDVWCAPIKTVVDRCKKLLDYGTVSVMEDSDAFCIYLVSSQTVADVHIEIFRPNNTEPLSLCIQLNSNVPEYIYSTNQRVE